MTEEFPWAAQGLPSHSIQCVGEKMAVAASTSDDGCERERDSFVTDGRQNCRKRPSHVTRQLVGIRNLCFAQFCESNCLIVVSPSDKATMYSTSDTLPYSQRPEWQDITPIPQHESLSPLAPIFYTDECTARSSQIKTFN